MSVNMRTYGIGDLVYLSVRFPPLQVAVNTGKIMIDKKVFQSCVKILICMEMTTVTILISIKDK